MNHLIGIKDINGKIINIYSFVDGKRFKINVPEGCSIVEMHDNHLELFKSLDNKTELGHDEEKGFYKRTRQDIDFNSLVDIHINDLKNDMLNFIGYNFSNKDLLMLNIEYHNLQRKVPKYDEERISISNRMNEIDQVFDWINSVQEYYNQKKEELKGKKQELEIGMQSMNTMLIQIEEQSETLEENPIIDIGVTWDFSTFRDTKPEVD